MIEISHKQARYLLRESEDRRLPDEQWAALQTHLESCQECCAYRDQLAGLEKNLHRRLHGRWGAVHPVLKDMPEAVVKYRIDRKQIRHRSLIAVLVMLIVLGLAIFRWYKQATAPVPEPTPFPMHISTPDPAQASKFHGLIVYQASPAGNSDIFLLNITGTSPNELTNLTNDPAEDTDPAWSPDGVWIAFLSDRSGKRELYVINVAGTHLTQLTKDPQVDWQGPVTWSFDGKMIGLPGRRETQNGNQWLYVVPITGTGPASLPGTRADDAGWVHFSPSQTLLATTSSVFDYINGWSLNNWFGLPANENTPVTGQPYGAEVDFDWGPGGNSLVYLFNGPPRGEQNLSESQIRVSPVFGLNNRDSNEGYTSEIATRAPAGSRFRSVIYVPDAITGGPHLATLIDLNHTGCWTVRMINLVVYNQPAPIDFPGLCVESPLERSSWHASGSGKSGRWLVVTARAADKTTGKPSGALGVYALYAGVPLPKSAPAFERLADLPKGSASPNPTTPMAVSIPRTQPSGKSLNIKPVSVKPPDSSLLAPIQPPTDAGILLAAEMDETQSANNNILRMNLDGTGQTILPGRHALNCPSWLPDKQFIAFTALDNSNQNEIFVMNGNGGNPIQRTQPYQPGISSAPGFDCPAWSPDGKLLAAVRYDVDGTKLEIIGRDEGVLRIVPVDSPSKSIRPMWMPDGKTVLLAEDANGVNSAAIVAIDWLSPAGAYNLNVLNAWKNVLNSVSSSDGQGSGDGSIQKILNIKAMSLSPDGKQLALITTRAAGNQQAPAADLLVFTRGETSNHISAELHGYNLQIMKTPGRIVWLPNNQILFALPDSLLSPNKAVFATLDLQNSQLNTLAFSKDRLIDWDWKDGWLVYSSESGVWVQKVNPPQQAANEPLRIFEQPVSSLELK
jgi:Tol biopolymer transport system component